MMQQPTAPQDMEQNAHPWAWFTDKVLPPIFVALSIGVISAAYTTHRSVEILATKLDASNKELQEVKADVLAIKANNITRAELADTMRRVEQQLEIMMLRAGIQPKEPRR